MTTISETVISHAMRRCVLLLIAMAAFSLGACSSLPRIAPDLALERSTSVPVSGARGPLSATQSKAIIDRLRSRSPDTDILARHLAVEEAIVSSPLTNGNGVVLLKDGPATYRAMLAAIAAARDHINMETYILEDDEIGRQFATALLARQAAGVQVNLLHDSVGTIATPRTFFQRLIDGGINVLEFNPINPAKVREDWTINQRDHRKLLIIDGRIAFLGGINISSVYSGGSLRSKPTPGNPGDLAWRDTDLQIMGPAVAELQKLFLASWAEQQGPPLAESRYFPPPIHAGPHVVRIIGSSPKEEFSQIYATLLSAIGSAENSVHITNAYFVPDPQLLTALESAAQRGVDVKLILPSQTDSWLVFHAGRGFYERLLRAGVKIHERRGVILHSKTALIDGVWATVGSTNLDWRSFLHNHELNAVVLGADFGSQLQAMFARDLAESITITLEQWERRPLDLRIKEIFARTWAYWL